MTQKFDNMKSSIPSFFLTIYSLMNSKNIGLFFLVWIFSASIADAQSKAEISQMTTAFRSKYKADFLEEERSPFYNKAEELKLLSFYKPKVKYRVACTFERTPNAKTFDMATYSGQVRKYVQYGWLRFKFKGKDRQLAVYQSLRLQATEEYKDHLFIPFKDLTNIKTTYGGGRYIDIKTSDIQDNQLILDFNQSYNPYCAFKDGYSCPIPPQENHLTWAVKAGEKKFKGAPH